MCKRVCACLHALVFRCWSLLLLALSGRQHLFLSIKSALGWRPSRQKQHWEKKNEKRKQQCRLEKLGDQEQASRNQTENKRNGLRWRRRRGTKGRKKREKGRGKAAILKGRISQRALKKENEWKWNRRQREGGKATGCSKTKTQSQTNKLITESTKVTRI